jgi:hypothetical protein
VAVAVIEVTVRVACRSVIRATPDLAGLAVTVDPDAPWLGMPEDL